MSGLDKLSVYKQIEDAKYEAHSATGDPAREPRRGAWSRYHNALQAAYESGDLVVAPRRASHAAPAPSDGLREAVDAAWNDAIEAAADANGYEHLAERAAIRALRRAAPTEGEA